MSAFDKKDDLDDGDYFAPAQAMASPGGFTPNDPWHIPGTDWDFQPFFDPFDDGPSPYQPKQQDPQVPGGDPPSPNPYKPAPPPGVPENPFTPEAQAKIKEKHRLEEEERLRRQKAMQELKDMAKQKPSEEKGDFPEHQGDDWDV